MFQITLNNKLCKKSLLINVHDIYPQKVNSYVAITELFTRQKFCSISLAACSLAKDFKRITS